MNETYYLDDIFKENNVVLVDTSAFNPHTDFYSNKLDNSLKERKQRLLANISYLDEIRSLVKLENFYITTEVEKEIIDSINYKYFVKNLKGKPKYIREFLLEPGLIRRHDKKLTRILNTLIENNKIVDPEIRALKEYKFSYNRYMKLKKGLKLSFTDYDLLITGLTLSFYNNKVGLITLDNGILRAWRDIKRNDQILNNNFSAYSPNKNSYGLVVGQN